MKLPYFKRVYSNIENMQTMIDLQEKELENFRRNQCDKLEAYLDKEGPVAAHHVNDADKNIDCTLYVRDADKWKSFCERDYWLVATPDVCIVDEGIILPLKKDEDNPHADVGGKGGVCSPDNLFVTGHERGVGEYDTYGAYHVHEVIQHIPETVVYGGLYIDHFGHFLSECLSRLWWYAENKDSNLKCVFISSANKIDDKFIELLGILGIPGSNIVLCQEPTQFDAVIVPEQSYHIGGGYTEKARMIYNIFRDSENPKNYEKVYLTKTKYPGTDAINEDYFESFFESQGYKIVSPEILSVKEQIALMAGVKQLACVSGTLGHQIVFCQDEVEILILNKNEHPLVTQCWMNQLRKAKSAFIDVSVNFLPHTLTASGYLLLPTVYWKKYLYSLDDKLQASQISIDLYRYLFEYVEVWAKRMWGFTDVPEQLRFIQKSTLADVIININEVLLNEKLDEEQKQKLRETFK